MDPSPAWQRRQQSSGTGEKNSRRPTGGSEGGSPLLKPRSEHPATPPLWGFQPQRGKKSTIDLQMAIIEKIKTIKTEVKKKNMEKCADLPCCAPLFCPRFGFFLFKWKKRKGKRKKWVALKAAASEVSNICSRLLIVLLPQSWFPMRLNFFPFLFYFVCATLPFSPPA